MTTKKVVVILAIFDAIDAMVLVITSERIEIEGCACAQNKALRERNGSIYRDVDWNWSERETEMKQIHHKTAETAKNAKSFVQRHFTI